MRYAGVMQCAEINSSFYRSPRASTYVRWAESTPEGFRFSVKVPKAITHECGLAPTREQLRGFLEELKPLGNKLGPLLLQLPPKQGFAEAQARAFLSLLRELSGGLKVVLEPRNLGWFTAEACELSREFRIARVVADPPIPRGPALEHEDAALVYYRLHGSPRVYYSSYSEDYLDRLGDEIRAATARGVAGEVWCIFDNTASGAALGNAVSLVEKLR